MLSEEDRLLWLRYIQGINPMGSSPMAPIQGLPPIKVTEPRQTSYDPRVDLHGVTVHEAYGVVQDHIYQGVQNGYKKLTIITGRSGQINQELPRWLEGNTNVRSVKQLANGGSWEVLIKRAT